jgi:sulfite exporter TauE/SafE
MIISLFLYGLLFGSGPCVASCGPLLISYVAGANKNILEAIRIYVLFSLSRISAYLLISLAIFFLGRVVLERALRDYSGIVYFLGGGFIIFIGIIMALGRSIRLAHSQFLEKKFLQKDFKSIVVFGLVIGFLPCAPLLAVFSYSGLIAKSGLQSLLYTLSFGLGTIISPLLLLTALAGFLSRFIFDKKAIYARIFNLACALIIIILGVQLIMRGF